MYYITVKASPKYHQMTFEELLFGLDYAPPVVQNETNTRTYEVAHISDRFLTGFSAEPLIKMLEEFNLSTEWLRAKPRLELYNNFYHEKNEGGYPSIFKGMFKKQRGYIHCNNAVLYADVRAAINPLLRQHPATEHAEIYERAASKTIDAAAHHGLVLTREDFDELLSSAYRKIDAPVSSLKEPLGRLKSMFECDFHAKRAGTSIETTYYHTAAVAYIKGRWTLDAIKRHQANESKWFAKLDFHNFFGTTTLEFAMNMLAMVFPFCEICKSDHGYEELRKAIELGFLNGVLPQGTPLSPTLTNIIMVPVDYRLSNRLRNTEHKKYVYTRYADDMQISSRFSFNIHDVENAVIETLREFDAPYVLNQGKTKYGSVCGKNWSLGVMLNKDNEITIGWRNKKRFEAMLSSYAMDRKNGIRWSAGDLMHMEGLRSYYRSVEQETIDKIIEHLSRKFGFNIVAAIKQDLRPVG